MEQQPHRACERAKLKQKQGVSPLTEIIKACFMCHYQICLQVTNAFFNNL